MYHNSIYLTTFDFIVYISEQDWVLETFTTKTQRNGGKKENDPQLFGLAKIGTN